MEGADMISCKEYAQHKKEELKARVNAMDRKPCLVVVQIGNDSASNSYIKGKKTDCEFVGIKIDHWQLHDSCTTKGVIDLIKGMNEDDNVSGIIVQLPIPKHLDEEVILNSIAVEKDVDGFRRDSCFKPCTPKGIIDWFDYNNYELEGVNAVVAGRSKIVGKPLVNMLIDRGATVTCIHSKTRNKPHYSWGAELFISAIGKPNYWDYDDFGGAEVIVDVGINRDENGKLCGDVYKVDFDNLDPYTYVTPVPNGVGLLTRVALLENVVTSAERKNQCGC